MQVMIVTIAGRFIWVGAKQVVAKGGEAELRYSKVPWEERRPWTRYCQLKIQSKRYPGDCIPVVGTFSERSNFHCELLCTLFMLIVFSVFHTCKWVQADALESNSQTEQLLQRSHHFMWPTEYSSFQVLINNFLYFLKSFLECLLARPPHIICITLGSVRSSHLYLKRIRLVTCIEIFLY